MQSSNIAVVLLNDLIFQVKIAEAAKRAGFKAVFVGSEAKLMESITAVQPNVIVMDINLGTVDPVGLIGNLKTAVPTRAIPVIGYISHVQVDLRAAATEAGCDVVLPRSTISEKLPELLARYGSPTSSPGEAEPRRSG